jgi:hypothetical protein
MSVSQDVHFATTHTDREANQAATAKSEFQMLSDRETNQAVPDGIGR